MNKKKYIILVCLILFLCVFIIFSFSNNSIKVKEGNKRIGNIYKIPIDRYEISYIVYFIDDNFIYLNFDEDNRTVNLYRYYIKQDKKIFLKSFNNYLVGTKNSVLINNTLYFYIGLSDSNKKPYNALVCINLTNNEIKIYNSDDGAYLGISTNKFKENVVTLKRKKENDSLKTYIEFFDTNSNNTKIIFEKKIDKKTNTGREIRYLYSNDENIYMLIDEYKKGKEPISYLKIYDSEIKEIKSIQIEGDLKKHILNKQVIDFAVFDNIIYLRNISNYSFLGKINGNIIETLLKDKNIDLSLNQESNEKPVFFKRGTNQCYTYNKINKELININLNLGNDYKIMCIYDDKENVIIFCYGEEKPSFIYFVRKGAIKDIDIPCK